MTLDNMSFYEEGFITNSHAQRKDTKRLKSASDNNPYSFERSRLAAKYLRSISNGSPLIYGSESKNKDLLKRSSYEFPYYFLQ